MSARLYTLGEFRQLTKDLPDNTPLLVPAFDHSYSPANVEIRQVDRYPQKNLWGEHWDSFDPTTAGGRVMTGIVLE